MSKLVIFSVVALVGIVVNFSLLYFMNFQLRDEINQLKNNQPSPIVITETNGSEKIITVASSSADFCEGCREDIDQLKKMISELSPTGKSFTTLPKSNTSLAKEYFVPMGSGSISSSDWVDVPGMSATIDSGNYIGIKSVTFQIALRIPTANGIVYARLFNKTDQHPVWYSEVFSEGPISTVKQASNLSLDSGSKLYQVQMKSTLKYEVIADSAQIKITLQ